jgi:adenine/guanine/hypoxanthine permease
MINFIVKYFKLDEKGTNIKTELLAGLTTFMAVVYIVPLNGAILGSAMPEEAKGAVIIATALITIVATIMTGLWSNTPITMSVGLGLNTYFAILVSKGIPWQTVLGIVFISGIFFLVLTLTNVRKLVINSISKDFKISISAGIGLFIAFVGLKNMKLIVYDKYTLVTLGNLSDKNVLLGLLGIFIIIALITWRLKGAFIIGMAITSIIGYIIGVGNAPDLANIFSIPVSIAPIAFKLDIIGALKLSLLPAIITFMLTDLFDSLGTLSGVGHRAGIFEEDDSRPIQKTLEVDAVATVLGSLVGMSTTTSFIESAAGVEEGGRTGLTSVFTGLLFTLTLFMLPLFNSIPPNAIYPVLVIVGVLMFADLKEIDFSKVEIGIPAFLIIILMPLTFSITKGLAAGFISYTFIKIISGKFKEINLVIIVLALISILAFIL